MLVIWHSNYAHEMLMMIMVIGAMNPHGLKARVTPCKVQGLTRNLIPLATAKNHVKVPIKNQSSCSFTAETVLHLSS
jgi:hypothetical protein